MAALFPFSAPFIAYSLCLVFALTTSINEAVAGDIPSSEAYALLETFHGHVCGGSLFGARLGGAAREALRAAGGKGKLKAHYFDLSCPVDGVQVFAGTTTGNGAFAVTDRDEHRLILTAEENNQQVEAVLTAKASALALRSKELGKKARKLPDGSEERLILEREIGEIYDWLRTASTEEVVTIVAGAGR